MDNACCSVKSSDAALNACEKAGVEASFEINNDIGQPYNVDN